VLGRNGEGTLTVSGSEGLVVLPVRWLAEESTLYAALSADTLALADAEPDAPAALTLDKASAWRARDMVGAMVQGQASFYVGDRLGSGAKTARQIAGSIQASADVLVRLAPTRLVWWKGWTSGSIDVG
jgi:hypothetical protein